MKNMAREGSFYWVFTHITLLYSRDGKVIGYLSVRRKPNTSMQPIVAGLYKQMLDLDMSAGSRNAIEVSTRFLMDFLTEKGMSYEEPVLALQG